MSSVPKSKACGPRRAWLVTVFALIGMPWSVAAAPPAATAPAGLEQHDLFVSGEDGYHTYRIPAIVVTPKGTVLAFCEGRKDARRDEGNIDLLLKRSRDGGRTFLPMQTIWDDADNTCGNPCPVIDRETGTIWLLLTHNPGDEGLREIVSGKAKGTRTVWITRSDDEEATWSKPVDITASTKREDWNWYATGPGCGIQLQSGRLVVPCDFMTTDGVWGSHVIFSDDHGKTWAIGGTVTGHVNECQVVELADGRLMLNMRNHIKDENAKRRAVAISQDGGKTFSSKRYDKTLVEPVCQASFLRLTRKPPADRNRALFSNPASEKRINMTVRLSYDEGETWPVAKPLHAGPSAYSAMAVLPDGRIACFYERGAKHPYEKITLATFTLGWLTDGKDASRRSLGAD